MHEVVEDGIGQGWVADDVMPFLDGKLARGDLRRAMRHYSRSGSPIVNGTDLSLAMAEQFPIGYTGEMNHSREGELGNPAQLDQSGPFGLRRRPRCTHKYYDR